MRRRSHLFGPSLRVCYHRRIVNADLHCHSAVSDGVLAPAELVRRAARNGVDMLALTDHDDVSGIAEARAAAAVAGIRFVAGVEISVTWRETTVHIVGLGVDCEDAALCQGLAVLRAGRISRARRMARALEDIGIRGALAGAARHAEQAKIIGRTHFARYLVERGVARDVRSVFDHYLVRGKPGYVLHRWASLEQALGWIVGAGGIPVLAHPGRYRVGRGELRQLIGEFQNRGGLAIEVTTGSHTRGQAREFARLARSLGLLASRASDFHAPEESRVELGATPPLPEDLTPVWSLLTS